MARVFSAGSDRITATPTTNPATNWTFSGWFKITTGVPTSYGVLFEFNQAGGGHNFNMAIAVSGTSSKLAYYATHAGSNVSVSDPGSNSFNSGAWNNVIWTVDGSSIINTYLNGVKDNIGVETQQTVASQMLSMGGDPGGTGFNPMTTGTLGEAGYWNVLLTTNEITALAAGARPISIRPNSLLGWWPIDGISSPEPDYSGLAHNGTVTGTAIAGNPPLMMFTPRWPQTTPSAVAATAVFRRSLSALGTRTGSRQLQAS